MRGRRIVVLGLLVGLLVGCSRSEEGPRWHDTDAMHVLDPERLIEGDGWWFDVGLEPWETGEPRARCLQPVVTGQPLGCVRLDARPGDVHGFTVIARAGGERVIWQADTMAVDGRSVDHFVVWSNASPQGRRVEPVIHADVVNLLWIMQPGEAPWGYQTIAPDGTLVGSSSFVGLPAAAD